MERAMLQFAAIYACWGVFVGVWVIGAVYNARFAPRTVSRDLWPWLRLWPVWIAAVVGVLLLRGFLPRDVRATLGVPNVVLEDSGLVILVGATLFTLWARWTLGKMWSGVPALR